MRLDICREILIFALFIRWFLGFPSRENFWITVRWVRGVAAYFINHLNSIESKWVTRVKQVSE